MSLLTTLPNEQSCAAYCKRRYLKIELADRIWRIRDDQIRKFCGTTLLMRDLVEHLNRQDAVLLSTLQLAAFHSCVSNRAYRVFA